MSSQGMPDAQRSAQSQLLRDHGGVLAKPPPIIGLKVFVATPVASQIDGETMPIRRNNLVPQTAMKTGRVSEQNWRARTRPLPYGQMGDSKQMHVQ